MKILIWLRMPSEDFWSWLSPVTSASSAAGSHEGPLSARAAAVNRSSLGHRCQILNRCMYGSRVAFGVIDELLTRLAGIREQIERRRVLQGRALHSARRTASMALLQATIQLVVGEERTKRGKRIAPAD